MDDTPANEAPGENFNKIDLTALEAFQFGTQWTDASKKGASGSADGGRGGADTGPSRRDRRPQRRPGEGVSNFSGPPPQGPRGDDRGSRPPRDRFPSREGSGGGPREGGFREGQGAPFRGPTGPGGDRGSGFERRPRFDSGDSRDSGPRRPAGPPRPYISPVFEITFYPDDTGFNALVKAMRASCRTYELFEIARLILGKVERCVLVYKRRPETPGGASGPVYVAVPDGVPFPTEDEAISHAFDKSMDQFFTSEVVEVEPPKGAFTFVSRCPVTKDLLAPANYHRFEQIVQHHHAARGIRIPYDRYKAGLEVVREPEMIAQWVESMKKATRFTFKGSPEGTAPTVFDNIEDARAFLLRSAREKIVRAVESVRISAKAVEGAGQTEAGETLRGALDLQRRFPLDTANALRGRLRRENFHIFKRGSKGVTFVCAVRRKFRQPGQAFSDSINALIDFLDKNPLVPVSELPLKLLGFAPSPAAPVAVAPAVASAAPAEGETAAESAAAPEPVVAPEPGLTQDQRMALNRLFLDLRWLVSEGYVAEYSDGRLFSHPVLALGQTEPEEKDHEPAPAPTEPVASSAEVPSEPVIEPVQETAPAEVSVPTTPSDDAPLPSATVEQQQQWPGTAQ